MTGFWKKLFSFAKAKLHSLIQIHDTPHAIAGGVGLGIFISFTPLFFIRVLLAVLLAWALRCSKIAAAIAVNLHELIFFLWPFVYRLEYKVGFWLLSNPHHFPPKLREVNLIEHLNWDMIRYQARNLERIGGPWMLGSMILGIPVAILSFFVTLKLVEAHQKKHPRH